MLQASRKGRWFVALVLTLSILLASTALAGCRADDSAKPEKPAAQKPPGQAETPSEPASGATESTPGAASGTSTGTASQGAGKPIPVRIYLLRGEKIGVAGRTLPAGTTGVAQATMRELLAAPSAQDRAYGLGTTIPKGTKLLGLSVKNGLATVDLSKAFESGGGSLSMTTRVAEVIYTLTQFPTIKRVQFRLDGRPVKYIGGEGISVWPPLSRKDCEGSTPAILLESPVPGAHVGRPARLTGTANTFEAAFVVRVLNAQRKVIAEKPAMATSGTGTRGTFNVLISYPSSPGRGYVQVFESSAKDGSEINKVTVPVYLK